MGKARTLANGAAVVAAMAALAVLSNAATDEATSSAAPSTTQSSPPAAPAAAHNQADMQFVQMMVPHHQQAIQMCDMILAKQGIDPRVVDLARQIKAAQGPEIDTMQGWLNQWGTGGMPGMSGMPGMDDMPGMGGMNGMPMNDMPGMPGMGGMGDMPGMGGMMSPADMDALNNASGVEASKLFLTQMITHHQGAIAMAQNEIQNGQFPDAIALAKSIASSQQQEIDTMNQILGTLK